jgi:hypothetical protein
MLLISQRVVRGASLSFLLEHLIVLLSYRYLDIYQSTTP